MTSEARTSESRTLWQVVIDEPLDLIKAQPHQFLLSTGSVALLGQFAGSSNIVDPLVGYLIAVGVEWAYLRGIASDSQRPTTWGALLNWSAFGIVVLWGILWCLKAFGVHPEQPTGNLAFGLAVAHVAPIAWLSLCSAMTHRAAMEAQHADRLAQAAADRERERQRQDELAALELEERRKTAEYERWAAAQRLKAELANAKPMPNRGGIVPFVEGKTATCPTCQTEVAYTTASEAGTIRRWGCSPCRAAKKQGVDHAN